MTGASLQFIEDIYETFQKPARTVVNFPPKCAAVSSINRFQQVIGQTFDGIPSISDSMYLPLLYAPPHAA